MTYTPTGGSDELSPELFNAIQEEAAQQLNTLNEVQSVEATESALQEEQQEESKDSSRPTRSSVGTKEKRDALFTVDNPEGTLVGPNATTPFARGAYDASNMVQQGVVDTVTDAFNWVTGPVRNPLNIPAVPKVGKYESNVMQAVRDISGLIVPSMGAKQLLIKSGTALHLSGKTAPWLQRLGNKKSFAWFSKFGADVGTSTGVDYVAKQNEENDNLFAMLKNTWPRFYQFIPDVWATKDTDNADIKRSKNVNEGAVFGLVGHLVEGTARILRTGRSVDKTTKLVAADVNYQGRLDELSNDEFSNIKFSDNALEDSIMKNQARRQKELTNLGEYLKSRNPNSTEPLLGVHDVFDPKESVFRTKDPDGILGAAADAAQIKDNIQTSYGRLGSVITNTALKYGLEVTNRTDETIIKELAKVLKQGGKYTKKLAGAPEISVEQIKKAGEELVSILLDPRMEPGDMFKLLDEFKITLSDGSKVLDETGYIGVMGAMKQYYRDVIDMDVLKARAYLTTSLAGQVSDIAEGVRLMDDPLVYNQAIDQIADRIEYLMVEKGLSSKFGGRFLRLKRTWETAKSAKKAEKARLAELAEAEHVTDIQELIPSAKNWAETMKRVAKNNPDFLKPLMLANEFSDGSIDSLYKLNKLAANKFGVGSKIIVDANPDMPSLLNKQFMSTVFNNTLSAFATPIRALVGNAGGLMDHFVSPMVGSMLSGDLDTMKRVFWGHWALGDTFNRSLKHMGLVYKKASTDPTKLAYVMREDVRIKMAEDLEVWDAYATAAEKNGELGPRTILNMYETLTDIAQDPTLRFGTNAMTALDGFSRSAVGSVEARYNAFDKLVKEGKPINNKNIKEVSDNVYKNYFDEEGMITDKAVEWATSEIALNLDSPFVDGFSQLLNKFPIARTHFMFPRTSVNVLDIFTKYSPGGIFAKEYKQLWGNLGVAPGLGRKLESFSLDEIQEVLARHEQTMDGDFMAKFKTIRAQVKGRVQLGTFTTMAALNAFRQGYITGNGHYDRSRQRSRIKLGWKPKTVGIPFTNKTISYEFLGPIGDWLGLVVDVADNMELASTAWQEQMFQKLAFIFSASLTNKSVLSNVEPLNDILQGDQKALNRWAASMGNNLLPLGGFRNEIGRVLNPALRDIKGDMVDNWRNRNNWLDLVDPVRKLPDLYDPIDGVKVNFNENFWERAWNAYSPVKVSDKLPIHKEFLKEIEYNYSPQLTSSTGGTILENHERTAISSKIGEQGIFKKEVIRIMKEAENYRYKGKDYPDLKNRKGMVEVLKYARSLGITSEELNIAKFGNIFSKLDKAFANAKKIAEQSIDPEILNQIRKREFDEDILDRQTKTGDIDAILNVNPTQ